MMNRQSRGNKLNTHELDRYLSEISKKPIHNQMMQHQFAIQAKAGDEWARNELIESNLKLVVHIAKDYQDLGADLMELVLAGNEGLCVAIDYYNPDKGCCFNTYASIWIREYIMNSINEQKRIVRIPRYAEQQLRKINKHPQDHGISEKRVDYINSIAIKQENTTNTKLDQDDPVKIWDLIPEDMSKNASKIVGEILAVMPPLMASYLNMAYGLDCSPLPTTEIGNLMGLGKKAAFQLRKDSINAFKEIWNKEQEA